MEAQDLVIGDPLTTFDGSIRHVTGIEIVPEQTTVYNFTVNGNHNYYVSEDGVLVHNGKGCKIPSLGPKTGVYCTTGGEMGGKNEISDSAHCRRITITL